MSYRLGIDLGTTYTAAAITRTTEGGPPRAEIVNLGGRAAQIPSVLHLSPDGSVLVGEAAERRVVTEPDRVVREFKRQVGDPTPIVVDGVDHTAHDLMALLVGHVVDHVVQREGGRPDRIALTHPASWGPHKLELLRTALQARGLEVEFLDEPRAAALSYAATGRVESGSIVAVYDLGGGTFDAALVRKNGGFTMLGRPEGIERLGGVDFDDAVFTHVRASIGDALDLLDPADEEVLAAVARLRRDCVEAKEALSADTEVRIPVLLPGLQTTVRLVRSEFEEMIRDDVEASVDALRRAVASAGMEPADLTAVLLVGGSSRIPLVAQAVSAGLGRPVAVDADPKNAIALGAALAVAPAPAQPRVVQPHPAPPRPAPRPSPSPGAGAVAGAAASTAVPTGPIPVVSGSRPSGGPPHEGDVPWPPPARPAAAARPGAGRPIPWGDDERPRRPVGIYVGAGGILLAALAAGVLLWPRQAAPAPAGSTTTVAPTSVTITAPAPPALLPAEVDSAPDGAPRVRPTAAGDNQAPPQEPVGVPPTTNPPPPTTNPPPPTTNPPPPTTNPPPPTTNPPPPTTNPPPPTTNPGLTTVGGGSPGSVPAPAS